MNRFLITTAIIAFTTMNAATAQTKNTDHKDVEKAKTWLALSIENNLNKANGRAENTNEEAEGKHTEIYTDKYIAYKNDAIEVDMDGGMTLKAFKKKWAKDFDCKYAGVGTGYLVSGTDYGFIEVTKCVLIKKIGKSYLFETIIRDTEAKIDYKRSIKIIPSGTAFLIEDVLEYN